jgi:Protein of unknown function (DUF1236)
VARRFFRQGRALREQGDRRMKKQTPIALAAALLLAGVTAASAAGMAQSAASNSLTLSNTQQKTAWKDLHTMNKQTAPSSFMAASGKAVPSTLKIKPVPSKTASAVPKLKPYDFAMVKGKLLIVNPSDRTIADVIAG